MTIYATDYGFSVPQSELEEILGMKPGRLARNNYDMDLADDCRTLAGLGIDLNDEGAVRQGFAATCGPDCELPPRYVDALVCVAKGFFEDAAA
jgi:hypothetical protein